MEKNTIQVVVNIVFKALAVAMGVCVVVLSRLGNLQVESAITLLGIGLACAGLALFEKK
ncbi:MAG: hypothetical protein ACI4U3_08265 [Traorella sp.]